MAKNPGMLVKFLNPDGTDQNGIVYKKDGIIKGKCAVYYVDGDFKPVLEGKEQKKRLVAPDKLQIIGYVD